jgi:hypothetical protein
MTRRILSLKHKPKWFLDRSTNRYGILFLGEDPLYAVYIRLETFACTWCILLPSGWLF